MEQDGTELYIQKLKESIDINRTLLTQDSETHRNLNQHNAQFQTLLQQVFEQSQAALPFFESVAGKISEEENQALIQYATHTTALHQQFFEVWKSYKELENQTGAQLSTAAGRIKAFAQE